MRAVLLASVLLAACSAGDDPSAIDAAADAEGCAHASCVEGASCWANRGSVLCVCASGGWRCGDASIGFDATIETGDDFDTGSPFAVDTAPPEIDANVPWSDAAFDGADCTSRPIACKGTTLDGQHALAEVMNNCSMFCARVTLETDDLGCVDRVSFEYTVDTKAQSCVVDQLSTARWLCGRWVQAQFTACPK